MCSGTSVRGRSGSQADSDSGGEVLGEIDPDRGVGHETGAGDPLLDLAADVGGVPRRPPCPQTGQDDLDHLVAVDPPDPRCAGHDR